MTRSEFKTNFEALIGNRFFFANGGDDESQPWIHIHECDLARAEKKSGKRAMTKLINANRVSVSDKGLFFDFDN